MAPERRTGGIFYGWWMVAACVTISLFGNALGLFGTSVYLHALTTARDWPVGLVSGAITLLYVTSAACMMPVASAIQRSGPRAVVALGAVTLAAGVIAIGRVDALWQVYPVFVLLGAAWACLSMPAITTTLAPWFETHQGRAASIASLGASAGGMLGVPVLMFGIQQVGFAATTALAGGAALAVMLSLALLVLRRRPEDLGLLPDGAPSTRPRPAAIPAWTRPAAMRTAALRTVALAFGIGMMVQIGCLTHHVALIVPTLGAPGASATVSATAVAALAGRLLLVRFADRVPLRATASGVLLLAAAAFATLALFRDPAALVVASIAFGLTVGNVTTLSAIIVRREFGAASFGTVYGTASTAIQAAVALGPGFYGILHDAGGGYALPLLIAAALDLVAAVAILADRRALLGAPLSRS